MKIKISTSERFPGFWLNFRTGVVVSVNEHAQYLRSGEVGKLLPELRMKSSRIQFDMISKIEDRDKFLIDMIRTYPIVRIREHGGSITCEFSYEWNNSDVVEACFKFIQKSHIPGDYSMINLIGFNHEGAVIKTAHLLWKDFKEIAKEEEWADVLHLRSKLDESKGFAKLLLLVEDGEGGATPTASSTPVGAMSSGPLLDQSIADQSKGPYTPGHNPLKRKKKKKFIFRRKFEKAF